MSSLLCFLRVQKVLLVQEVTVAVLDHHRGVIEEEENPSAGGKRHELLAEAKEVTSQILTVPSRKLQLVQLQGKNRTKVIEESSEFF